MTKNVSTHLSGYLTSLIVAVATLCTPCLTAARQSVGLVLSGGGAKGIAHIGVIKALEDNDIPIDYVTGTSMGAIVGGLYASGYSPDEMLDLIQSKGFKYWSTGTIDPADVYYFGQAEPMPRWASINLSLRDSTSAYGILPSSLISPLPMNIAFVELFAKYTAQCRGDFNRLFVPLRTVTSDVYHKHKIVCSSGSLGDAIRASMSFPIVFSPIEMDGVLVYDGGIYDNFPVDVMRDEFAPDIMIGIDVSSPDKKPERNNIMQQVEDMIIQNNDYSLPEDEGIKLRVKVQQFGLLDFSKCMEIYQIGYDYAMSMMDSIKSRISARSPKAEVLSRRQSFKDSTPKVVFRSVSATGASKAENDFVREMFIPKHTDTFGIEHARQVYYELVTPGHYRDLVPKAVLDTASGMFDLNLFVDPKKDFSLGLGGYITTSSNSMLFLSTSYHRTGYNALNVSIDGWIGQSYLAGMVSGRMNLRTNRPSYILMRGVISRQNLPENSRLFNYDAEAVVTSSQAFAKFTYGMEAGRTGKLDLTLGGGRLANRFYNGLTQIEAEEYGKSRLVHHLGILQASFDDNTLDNRTAPLSGHQFTSTLSGVAGNATYLPLGHDSDGDSRSHPAWVQFNLNYRKFWRINPTFSFGLNARIAASSQKLLDTYGATMVMLPAFHPTPSSYDRFYPELRAPQFATIGIEPVWSITRMLQLRGQFHCFMPFRQVLPDIQAKADIPGTDIKARYGDWFSSRKFFTEIDATYTLPFAQISAFVNYANTSSHRWNVGISFGLFLLAPRFIP
ncbi:MAG: patatin-like phospholipase family protein [Muribaculum sp.]|nr:patatin-like phospholipase family protein [Muribaculum sp.]